MVIRIKWEFLTVFLRYLNNIQTDIIVSNNEIRFIVEYPIAVGPQQYVRPGEICHL